MHTGVLTPYIWVYCLDAYRCIISTHTGVLSLHTIVLPLYIHGCTISMHTDVLHLYKRMYYFIQTGVLTIYTRVCHLHKTKNADEEEFQFG